jgi:hypothetical protein
MKKLLCPICERPLEITTKGHYETLSEHVSSPNDTPSLKEGYTCTYEYCIANNLGATWIESGELYMHPPDGVAWTVAHDIMKKCSNDGDYHAIGSWERYYSLGKSAVDRKTKSIKLGKFKVKIIPKTYGYNAGDEKQYMPRKWGWNFEYWKRSHDGMGYTHISPIYRMVKFCIKQFNYNYSSFMKTGNKNSLKKAMDYVNGYNFGRKDDRLYVKISSFLIKTLYPIKVKTLKKFEKYI